MGTTSVTRPDRDGALFASVETTVLTTILDVVGEDFYEESEVGLESTFAEDLDLESMEVMEVSERLIETYGDDVDFIGWFAEMELEDLVALTVGMVVDFVVSSFEK